MYNRKNYSPWLFAKFPQCVLVHQILWAVIKDELSLLTENSNLFVPSFGIKESEVDVLEIMGYSIIFYVHHCGWRPRKCQSQNHANVRQYKAELSSFVPSHTNLYSLDECQWLPYSHDKKHSHRKIFINSEDNISILFFVKIATWSLQQAPVVMRRERLSKRKIGWEG